MNRIRTLHLVALTVLSLAAIPAMAAENYLLAAHKQRLEKARVEESAAKSTWDKAFALRQQAAELDSMGKSAEALIVIDRAAYAKFAKGDAVSARTMLDDLNRVAPYGSIEWIYGQRVL